jgi:hypothetical protein
MYKYLVSGTIMLESTREEASYEFEMEAALPPDEMDILSYMMETGEIQILHESTEEV